MSEFDSRIQDLARLAASLVDAHKGEFLGSFIEGGAEGVVVVAGTSEGASRAREVFQLDPDVEVRVTRFSINEVREFGDRVRLLSPKLSEVVSTWGADPRNGGMFLVTDDDLNGDDRAAVEAFAQENQIPVRVIVDQGGTKGSTDESRPTDPSAYAGSGRYLTATGSGQSADFKYRCTSGLGYVRGESEYMLTAGHCMPENWNGDYMWIVSGPDSSPSKYQYAGHLCCTTYYHGIGTTEAGNDQQFHGDLTLINVSSAGRDAGNKLWWGTAQTTNKIPVSSRTAPTPQDPVCFSGEASGSDCGTVVQFTNVSHTYSNGETIRNADAAYSYSSADCSVDGDSGAAVVVDHPGAETSAEATGIVSGHSNPGSGGCFQWFTGIEEGMQAWGGGLHFLN